MLLPYLTSGQLAASVLLVLMCVEIATLLLVLGKKAKAPFGEGEKIKPEGREYATRATTLGGLTFAAIALLVGTFYSKLSQLSDVLFLMGLSIGLFLVSYSIEVLVQNARGWWIIQDKTLWYGFVSIVVALAWFFQQFIPDAFLVMMASLLVIAAIHSYEFYLDVKSEWPLKVKK